MPYALINLSAVASDQIKSEIAQESMKILADVIGKPISYCSVQVISSIGGFGGKIVDSAFIDIRSIGGLKGKQQGLSDRFCTLLNQKLAIDPFKIYLNFSEFSGSDWGHNHATF